MALEFDSKTGRESEGCVLCLLFPSEIRAHPRFPPPSPLLPLDQKKGYSILQRSPLALVPELFRRRRGRLTAVNLLPPPRPHTSISPPFSLPPRCKNAHVRAHTAIAHFGLLPGGGEARGGGGSRGATDTNKSPENCPLLPAGGCMGGVYLPIFWAAEKGA